MHLALVLWLGVVSVDAGVGAAQTRAWERTVALLNYLEGDYPKALASKDAFELEEQKGLFAEAIKSLRETGPEGQGILEQLELLAPNVARGDDPSLSLQFGTLAQAAAVAGRIATVPRTPPDLVRAHALWKDACAVCHGLAGDGRPTTPLALNPPPANFHDEETLAKLTPFKVFTALGLGVPGTAMPAFAHLSDDDRWSLSSYLFTLKPGRLGAVTQTHLDEAIRAAKAHDWALAKSFVVDAYLEGFEPLEPAFRARDSEGVRRAERAFVTARLSAEAHSEDFPSDIAAVRAAVESLSRPRDKASFWSVLLGALLIVLREGFEALVVVGALLAVLKKMGAGAQARWVHLGWLSALVAGAAAFFFGQSLLAGARREYVEAVTAMLAVGMLLYAALWLNARAQTSQHMGDVRSQMQSALTRQSRLGLWVVSFTAVFRESAETALFVQGLSGDSPSGAAWGAAAGVASLAALVLFISIAGFRLPMKTLFSASTGVMVATAVVLLGKGLHAFQEVGALPFAPLSLPSLEALGLFADAVSLMPQVVLAGATLAYFVARRRKTAPPRIALAPRA